MVSHEKKSPAHSPKPVWDCDVVLPYYDSTDPYVQTAIDSILIQQDARCIVHIVAIDVMEENYRRLTRHYDGYTNLRFHRMAKPLGFYNLLLYLLEEYETDYIAFQHSSDIALPWRIKNSISLLQAENAEITSCATQNLLSNAKNTDHVLATSKNTNCFHGKNCKILMRESVVLKKTLIRNSQYCPEKLKNIFAINMYWIKHRVAIDNRILLLRRIRQYRMFRDGEIRAYQQKSANHPRIMDGFHGQRENVVLTTYFTNMPDPQYGNTVLPNDPDKMRLADSCIKLGLHCVVFHDNLDEQFCKKYPQITFIRVPNKDMAVSCNNLRFYVYLQWLKQVRYTNVWLCDLFDVEIKRDPNTLETKGKIWMSIEHGQRIKGQWWKVKFYEAYGYTNLPAFLKGKLVLNAGVWGGDYKEVVHFLQKYVAEMSRLPTLNSNMAALNVLMRRTPSQNVVMCTEPLVSKFKKYENRDDVCFIHK